MSEGGSSGGERISAAEVIAALSLAADLSNSNPITGMVVADLNLTEDQRARLRQTLDGVLRDRAGRDRQATLTNGVNIGIGTK